MITKNAFKVLRTMLYHLLELISPSLSVKCTLTKFPDVVFYFLPGNTVTHNFYMPLDTFNMDPNS